MQKLVTLDLPTAEELWEAMPWEAKSRIQLYATLPENTYNKWWRDSEDAIPYAGKWLLAEILKYVHTAIFNTILYDPYDTFTARMGLPTVISGGSNPQVEMYWQVSTTDTPDGYKRLFNGGIIVHSDGSIQSHT